MAAEERPIGRLLSAAYRIGPSGSFTQIPFAHAAHWRIARRTRFSPGGVLFGRHTGSSDSSVLSNGTLNLVPNSLVGKTVVNITDGSSGTISANTTTTVTATLAGGTDNDWDNGDEFEIQNIDATAATKELIIVGELYTYDPGIMDTLIDLTPYNLDAIVTPEAFPQLQLEFRLQGTSSTRSKRFHPVTFGIGEGAEIMTLGGAGRLDYPIFRIPWAVMMDPRDTLAAHVANS